MFEAREPIDNEMKRTESNCLLCTIHRFIKRTPLLKAMIFLSALQSKVERKQGNNKLSEPTPLVPNYRQLVSNRDYEDWK